MTTFLFFIGPIALVLLMAIAPQLNGWKTNTQGTIIAILGSVQIMNLNFLSTSDSSALLAGAGIAVLIASRMTKRVK